MNSTTSYSPTTSSTKPERQTPERRAARRQARLERQGANGDRARAVFDRYESLGDSRGT